MLNLKILEHFTNDVTTLIVIYSFLSWNVLGDMFMWYLKTEKTSGLNHTLKSFVMTCLL